MLHSISWTEYFIFFAAATAVYYAVLAATCYRREISGGFFRRSYKPKYRTDISIPVVNGVMGSVLFEEADEKPTGGGGYVSPSEPAPSTTTKAGFPGDEDFDPAFEEDGEEEDGTFYDEYENDADRVAQMDIVEDLVRRFTEAIDKAPPAVTADELVETLAMIPGKGDKEAIGNYRESIANDLIEKAALKLDLTLTEKSLRPLWV
ncbi:hypothetical protein LL912_12575 [Niabella sp. CC-SYL272]|uniref:hypothetical protein n=1 Tax=Niabella agricola TaxID=2891571 RepID=UPI001F212AA2|nr:hypothetical protein [Niabella agricola]MCF3109607.1 hypothetical protein [Niabella agricola]